jgi:ABC-type multidrug transport system fused ATPase/permease subunit
MLVMERCDQISGLRQIFRGLASKSTKLSILYATLSATLSTSLLTTQPFLLGEAIASAKLSISAAAFWAGLYIGVGLLAGAANGTSSYFTLKSREEIGNDIARATLLATLAEPIDAANRTEADLLHLFNKAKEGCHALIADLFSMIVPYCLGLLLALGLVSSRIDMFCGFAMGLIAFGYFALNRSTATRELISGQRLYVGSANVVSDIGRAHELKELVRCFSAQNFVTKLFERHLAYNRRRVARHGRLYFWKQIKLEILQWFGLMVVILIFFLGAKNENDIGKMGGVLTLILSYFQVIGPITALSRAGDRVSQALIAVLPTAELLNQNHYQSPQISHPPQSLEKLVVDTVLPQYVGRGFGAPISARMSVGDVVFIKGRSGIGKTTFARTIAGIISPRSGKIYILTRAGHRVERICAEILYVPQTDYVFAASIVDNIRLGETHVSEEAVQKALEDLQVDTVLKERKLGLRSMIGDGGKNWSGGQRRRIALCRALVRKPAVLILDEPTANLDPETAQRVLDRFRDHMRDGILIIITHEADYETATDRIINIGFK